ncbi:MAG: hypothetical protein ABH873_04735 [Candidatus Firestonebacteria bacterium]
MVAVPIFSEEKIIDYHLWLTYRNLPHNSYPISLPEAKFGIKGWSNNWGYGPLSSLTGEFNLEPLLAVRIRNEINEDINPFKELIWRPHLLEAESIISETKKIQMKTVFVNDNSVLANITFVNESKEIWKQEVIIYVKGEGIQTEDAKVKPEADTKKSIGIFSIQNNNYILLQLLLQEKILEYSSISKEEDKYKIFLRILVPGNSSISFNVSLGISNDLKSADDIVALALNKDINQIIEEKKIFLNKLLMGIPQIKKTDIPTRNFYQAAYLLINDYKLEDQANFSFRFMNKAGYENIKNISPWMLWKIYEFNGDIKYLEEMYSKMHKMFNKEPETVLDLYNLNSLNWINAILNKENINFKKRKLDNLELEEKVLYLLLEKFNKKDIELEVNKLILKEDLKYPEIYFIIDSLIKYNLKDLAVKLIKKLMPGVQRDGQRTLLEMTGFLDLYFKLSGMGFERGNIIIQPLNLYTHKDIFNFKYKGNILNFEYKGEGKFINKVLIDDSSVYSRVICFPVSDSVKHNIVIFLNDKPTNPILNYVKANTGYSIKKCGWDEKEGVFNINLDSPPLEEIKAIFDISKNSKKIKKVTINWKDISKFSNIKIEIK